MRLLEACDGYLTAMQISERLGVGVPSVRRSLRRLVEEGDVKVVSQRVLYYFVYK